jgi:hypothetical protein
MKRCAECRRVYDRDTVVCPVDGISLQDFACDPLVGRTIAKRYLIETDEGVQLAVNGDSVVQILSRWEKEHGLTRILRLQRGEVWARIADGRRAVEIETPVGVLAARSAEVNMRLVSDNEAVATVVTGTAEFSTPFADCALRAGTMSFGHRSKACTPPAATDVRTVVGWGRPLLP